MVPSCCGIGWEIFKPVGMGLLFHPVYQHSCTDYSETTGLLSTPTPLISISTVSPG